MNEKLKDIMTAHVETILPTSTVQEAAEKMKSLDVGILPVCSQDKIIGIVTDRDITIKAIAINHDPRATTVDEIMTTGVYSCYEDEDIESALKIMEQRQVRRLAILDRNQHLVGIASIGDLVLKTQNEKRAGEALEKISEPNPS